MKCSHNILSNIIQALIVSLISLILATTALHELSSLMEFEPSVQGDDFQMSDIYNYVADSRSVRTLSEDVTIIGLDGCSRNDIAQLFCVVDSLRPAAVGLDVLFLWEYDGDEVLIDAVNNCNNLVLPVEISDQTGTLRGSYFYSGLERVHLGAINLDSYSLSQSVRTFYPTLRYGNDTINSFGAELVSLSAPEKYQELLTRNNESETIAYPSTEFMVLDYKEVISAPGVFLNDIEGKVVLMGALKDRSDYHVTPINVGTPGVMIHAYIVDTILNNKYITSTPVWLSWLMAFWICFIFVSIDFLIDGIANNLNNLVIRILQALCLYLFFALGCRAFIDRLHYIDFAPTLLMIGLGIFAYDLWVGLYSLYRLIFKR